MSTANFPTASSSAAPAVPMPAASANSVLFARGVIALLRLWPALRLAIANGWGGPESEEKRDFLASYLLDMFDEAGFSTGPGSGQDVVGAPSTIVPSSSSASSSAAGVATLRLDAEDVTDVLMQYVNDEYEMRLEDDSAEEVGREIFACWEACVRKADERGRGTAMVEALEERVRKIAGKKVRYEVAPEEEVEGGSDEEDDDEDGSEDEDERDGMDVDGPADDGRRREPQRPEPIVDEDGFTTVVRKGRR